METENGKRISAEKTSLPQSLKNHFFSERDFRPSKSAGRGKKKPSKQGAEKILPRRIFRTVFLPRGFFYRAVLLPRGFSTARFFHRTADGMLALGARAGVCRGVASSIRRRQSASDRHAPIAG